MSEKLTENFYQTFFLKNSLISVKMDPQINKLIAECTDPHGTVTHRVTFPGVADFRIPPKQMVSFWCGYNHLLYSDDCAEYNISELLPDVAPVILTCNFEFNEGSGPVGSSLEDSDALLLLIKGAQDAIEDTFEISPSKDEFKCIVLYNNDYNIKEDNKEILQLRLQFPFCRTDRYTLQNILLPKIQQNLLNSQVINKFDKRPINASWTNIITQFKDYEDVLLYRSKNGEKKPALYYQTTYARLTDDMIGENANRNPPEIDLSDKCFDLKLHRDYCEDLICDDFDDKEYWLPLFMSIHYNFGQKCKEKIIDKPKKRQPRKKGKVSGNNNKKEKEEKEDYDDYKEGKKGTKSVFSIRSGGSDNVSNSEDSRVICDQLLPLLKEERYKQENYRLDVGKAIYNIYDGEDEGLDIWIRFVEPAGIIPGTNKCVWETCTKLWENDFETQNYIGIKTIAWYAKQDNPEEYNKWHKAWYKQALRKAVDGGHDDIGRAFYRIFWLEFACVSTVGNGDWYHFKQNHWNRAANGARIRGYLGTSFKRKFEEYQSNIIQKSLKEENQKWKEQYQLCNKKITKIIENLGNGDHKRKYLKALADIFYLEDEEFASKLNKNKYLLGVKNGIIEMTKTQAVFRQGKPEDYVSMFTPVKYDSKYSWDHPKVLEMKKWYRQTYIDENIMEYKMRLDASFMVAGNQDKVFPIFTGESNNSKSMWKKLYDAAYGPYAVDFPLEVLTKQRSGGGPSPEIAQAEGARLAHLAEPDNAEAFRNGMIKLLTGGDSIFTRKCNENGGKIISTFVLMLFCNMVPIIPNCDVAIKKRLKIVPHLSTWVEPGECPDNEEDQFKERLFPMDPTFEDKIPKLAAAFLWICVQKYREYCIRGLDEPEEVTKFTQDYWDNFDIFQVFQIENIEKVWTKDENGRRVLAKVPLSLNDIFKRFTPWFKENYPNVKIVPDKATVRKELSIRWKSRPNKQNVWFGIRLKETEQTQNIYNQFSNQAQPAAQTQLSNYSPGKEEKKEVPKKATEKAKEKPKSPTKEEFVEQLNSIKEEPKIDNKKIFEEYLEEKEEDDYDQVESDILNI